MMPIKDQIETIKENFVDTVKCVGLALVIIAFMGMLLGCVYIVGDILSPLP